MLSLLSTFAFAATLATPGTFDPSEWTETTSSPETVRYQLQRRIQEGRILEESAADLLKSYSTQVQGMDRLAADDLTYDFLFVYGDTMVRAIAIYEATELELSFIEETASEPIRRQQAEIDALGDRLDIVRSLNDAACWLDPMGCQAETAVTLMILSEIDQLRTLVTDESSRAVAELRELVSLLRLRATLEMIATRRSVGA